MVDRIPSREKPWPTWQGHLHHSHGSSLSVCRSPPRRTGERAASEGALRLPHCGGPKAGPWTKSMALPCLHNAMPATRSCTTNTGFTMLCVSVILLPFVSWEPSNTAKGDVIARARSSGYSCPVFPFGHREERSCLQLKQPPGKIELIFCPPSLCCEKALDRFLAHDLASTRLSLRNHTFPHCQVRSGLWH